jgi:hypothetical protein
MGLKIQRRVTTKARVITTLIAVFALIAQPAYGFVAGQVANAITVGPQNITISPNSSNFTVMSDVISSASISAEANNSPFSPLSHLTLTPSGNLMQAMKEVSTNYPDVYFDGPTITLCADTAIPYGPQNNKTCADGGYSYSGDVSRDGGVTVNYVYNSASKVGTWTATLSSALKQQLVNDKQNFGFSAAVVDVAGNSSSVETRNFDFTPAPTIQPCTSVNTVKTTDMSTWNTSETRANGHNELVSNGLHVWTDSNTDTGSNGSGGTWNTDKAAGYHPASFNLADLGKGFGVTTVSGSGTLPSLQLLVDLNNDGHPEGYLVGESIYGTDSLWLSSNWTGLDISSAPTAFDGGGTGKGGSINAWLAAFPHAKVSAIGYSLGSGVHGDYTISELTAGCTNYTFAKADTTKPTATFTSSTSNPTPNGYYNGSFTVGYEVKDLNLSSVYLGLFEKGTNKWIANCDGVSSISNGISAGTCTINLPANLSDGNYYVQVGGRDMAGNYAVNAVRDVKIQRNVPAQPSAPFAEFQYGPVSVANNSYLKIKAMPGNNNLNLQWNAPSDWVTGYRVLATFPDGTTNVGYGGPNTNAWLIYNGFGQHGNGKYTYRVVAVNPNGTSTPSDVFTLYYDTQGPEAHFTTTLPTSVNGNFHVEAVASDNVGLKDVFFDIRDSSGWVAGCVAGSSDKVITADGKSATLSCDMNTASLVNGQTYTLRVHASDNVNYGGGQDVQFVFDTTAPVVSINKPTDTTASVPIMLTGHVDDAHAKLSLFNGTTNIGDITDITTNGDWTYVLTSGLSQGTPTLRVVATDASGNRSTVTTSPHSETTFTVGPFQSSITPVIPAFTPPAPARPTPGANFVGSTTLVDPPAVLGTQTAKDNNSGVLGTSDKVAAIAPSAQGWKIFGVAWYWWVLMIAAVAAIMWWIIAAARRRNQNA